jgi:hypothetical protein
MKKSILFSTLFFIFVAQLKAQWTTANWYGAYWTGNGTLAWGWNPPASDNYTGTLYRNGSLSILEPYVVPTNNQGGGFTVQGKGYLFLNEENKHWEWNCPNYGMSMGDFSRFNISQHDSYHSNNLAVVMSGYGGVGLRSESGALMLHQNGIVSIGFSQMGRDQAKIRELSKKAPAFVSGTGGYTLYVRNGIVSDKIKVAAIESWPDYVFRKGYPLLTLSQVDTFIQTKGHLPNTPSAEVVERQGLELGATAKNHQEKIEEVFLHLIDLEKRLKSLEAENAALKARLQLLEK